MADRVPASIELGGVVDAAAFAEIVETIQGEALLVEWDGEAFAPHHRIDGEPLRLYALEVAWGRFDRLEALCMAQGLPFARWSGGYPGAWGAERLVFTGAGEPHSYAACEEDEVYISRYVAEKLGSFDAVIAYFDAADFRVPALVIAG